MKLDLVFKPSLKNSWNLKKYMSNLNPQGFNFLRIGLKPTPGEPIIIIIIKINIRTRGSLEKEEPTQQPSSRSAAKVN
jgi:hypothetical protein